MKKILLLLPLLLLLTGCGKNKQIYGEVISVSSEGQYVQLTVRTQEDQDRRILADGHTLVYSFAGIEEGLLSGNLIRPYITAYDLKRMDGAFLSERICVESIQLPEGYELKDGTILTIRKDYRGSRYEAPDGTEILWEQEPIGPGNVSVGGLPTLDMLSEQAQEAVLSYYEKLGFLYDLDQELERAWQDYLTSDKRLAFQSRHLSQDISPCAANDTLIWYTIYVTLPAENGLHHQLSTQTAFDRKTGNVLEPAALFSCDEAELIRHILDHVDMPDTALAREMEQNFQFAYLNFESNTLGVCFPIRSLPSDNRVHIISIDYADLGNLIHPWAIPDTIE